MEHCHLHKSKKGGQTPRLMQQGKEITKIQMGLSHVGSRAHALIISTLHNKNQIGHIKEQESQIATTTQKILRIKELT